MYLAVDQGLAGRKLPLAEALADQAGHQEEDEDLLSLEQSSQAIPALYHCKVEA